MKIKSLFVGDTNNTFIQFFRYCFVGGFATVVDWGLSFVLFHFVFNNQLGVVANGLSFVAGLIVNYFLSTFWIFKNSKIQKRFVEFLSFAAIGVVGLLLTLGITWAFEATLQSAFPDYYQIMAKVVSTAVSFFWNFFARKVLLFDKNTDTEKSEIKK